MKKIIKDGVLRLTCPTCGCEFQFEGEDTYKVGIGGINRAVDCPFCKSRIIYHNVLRS